MPRREEQPTCSRFCHAYDRLMIHAQSKEPAFDGPASFIAEDIAGHRIEILTSGEQRLAKLLTHIASAKTSINIIMYIFADDDAGRAICAALVSAAARGVQVRAIIDRFGSSLLPPHFYDALHDAGGKICFFSRQWRSSYLIRNHQKLILIDGRTAITGGFNIENDYLMDDGPSRWLDLGLIVTGPSLSRLRKWCDRLFTYTTEHDGKILKLRRIIRHWPVSKNSVSWLVGGPTERLSPWTKTLKRDMNRAKRIDVAMAYFSPGQGMLRRLGRIAKQGTARFLLSGKSDNPATIGASRLLYGFLLKRGASISEYSQRRFHMKLIVIDDITYIGTANFDVRSLFINVELMLRVSDSSFAADMRQLLDHIEAQSTEITAEIHKNRAGFLTRLRWLLSYMIVGVMDYTVSRRLNFGLGQKPYRDRL
jgi:cardiolipin synthase